MTRERVAHAALTKKCWILVVGLGCFLARPQNTAAGDVSIRIELAETARVTKEPSVFVSATREGSGEPPKPVRASIEQPVNVTLGEGLWTLVPHADDYWGPSKSVLVQSASSLTSTTLTLWPSGAIKGRVRLPSGAYPPDLSVTFSPSPGDEPSRGIPSRQQIKCPLEQTGEWKCNLPAGLLDVKFGATGFIYNYLWNVRIPAGGELDLGENALEPGASVVGYVRTPDDEPGIDANVELATLDSAPILSSERSVLGQPMRPLKTVANERGFFQIRGVPAGEFLLVAKQAPFGEATEVVRTYANRELDIIRPLHLAPPGLFETWVDPPNDPEGHPWRLTLLRLLGPRPVLVTTPNGTAVPEDGHLQLEGLPMGKYLVTLTGRSIGGVYSSEILIEDAFTSLPIQLSITEVEGRLSLGTQPLAGVVYFGGRRGAVSVAMDVDEGGRFTGLLPRDGDWSVEVESKYPAVHRVLPKVNVRTNSSGSAAVRIRLPETRIRGMVVDRRGAPVGLARVHVRHLDVTERPVELATGFDGKFSSLGLPEGRSLFSATVEREGETLTSAQTLVTLQEDIESPPVRLVVERSAVFQGRVFSDTGAVPNASVRALAAQAMLHGSSIEISDLEGRFKNASLPPDTQEVLVSVGAGGLAYRIFRLRLSGNEEHRIRLSSTGGTIVIDPYTPPSAYPYPERMENLLHDGGVEEVRALIPWAMAHGGGMQENKLIIPNMEPGDYRLCSLTLADSPAVGAGSIDGLPCDSGTLLPGDQLVFKGNSPP